MEKQRKNLLYSKGGNGGYTIRVALPREFIDELNLSKEENTVNVYMENGKIVIEKSEVQLKKK